MKKYVCAAAITICLASAFSTLRAQGGLPPGWPARLELGMADSPGGAAAMKATAPFAFRYQYLAGGVNTGSGWATWNSNGEFARYYIEDSVANGIVPVFSYYQMFQSLPPAHVSTFVQNATVSAAIPSSPASSATAT